MTFYCNNLLFSFGLPVPQLDNLFVCRNSGIPWFNNNSPGLFVQNVFGFESGMASSNLTNFDTFRSRQWSDFHPDTSYQPQKLDCGNWFSNSPTWLKNLNFNNPFGKSNICNTNNLSSNITYGFGNAWQSYSYTRTVDTQWNRNTTGGREVSDGTEITVDGIDYSIMGHEASKVKLLRPEMQRKVYEMFRYARSRGWTITISSGYRSTERQRYIYNEWKAGRYNAPIVAKPGTSRHEYGCAIDIRVSGRGASINEMGRYGKSIGLRWGGDWSSNRETWHFDIDPRTTARGLA